MKDSNGIYTQVKQAVRQVIDGLTESGVSGIINAAAVARAAYDSFLDERSVVPMKVEWTSVEHCKQVARAELRGKFGHDAAANATYQDDMFSGHLQEYYPVRLQGEPEPVYKRRELLSDNEIRQNADALRKQGNARLMHADALLAFLADRSIVILAG